MISWTEYFKWPKTNKLYQITLIFDIININSLNLEILMNIYERMQTLINVQQILLVKCISLNVNVILVSTFTEDFTQLLSQEEKRMKIK